MNSELLNNLGNFINRALSFLKNNFGGVVPEMNLNEHDFELLKDIKEESERWDDLFNSVKLRDGVRSVLEMSRKGNQYIQAQQPWVLIKGSEEQKYVLLFFFNIFPGRELVQLLESLLILLTILHLLYSLSCLRCRIKFVINVLLRNFQSSNQLRLLI